MGALAITLRRYGMVAAFFAIGRDGMAYAIGRFYGLRCGWGRGARIAFPARIINAGYIHVGSDFSCGAGLWLEAVEEYSGERFSPEIRIGDRVTSSGDLHLAAAESVCIGNDVLIGRRVLISDHSHGRYDEAGAEDVLQRPVARRLARKPVRIGDRCWIGEGACVLPGASIGEGSVIGANAVVSTSIPPYSVAVGVPARVVKRFNQATRKWERL